MSAASLELARLPGRAVRLRLVPNVTGVVLLVAGLLLAAAGVWIGVPGALAMGAVLVLAWVLDGLVLLAADPWRGAVVLRRLSPQVVQAGQRVEVTLVNAGAAPPGWLRHWYQDVTPWGHGPVTVMDDTRDGTRRGGNRADRGDRADRQTQQAASYTLVAAWRGQAEFGPANLLADSALGLWRARRVDAERATVMVWPATVPLVVPAPNDSDRQSSGALGLPRPRLDDTTMREYQPGDDLHRVHWRSLARGRKLMTRAEEPTYIQRTTGVLWLLPKAGPDAADVAVSVLASWAEAMARAGHHFDLQLGDDKLVQPTRPQLLEALAMVDDAEMAGEKIRQRPGSGFVVAAAGETDEAVAVPADYAEGTAVVLAPPSARVTVPPGWKLLRLPLDVTLLTAAAGLQPLLTPGQGVVR